MPRRSSIILPGSGRRRTKIGTFAENRMKAIKKWKDAEKKYNEAKSAKDITDKDGSSSKAIPNSKIVSKN